MARNPARWLERSPRILLVNGDVAAGSRIRECLSEHGVKSSWVRTAKEAVELLHDMVFIESSFDGLLVEYELPDGGGFRVIREFRHEFPTLATALMSDVDDIALGLWSKQRQIPVLRKPIERDVLLGWLEQFKSSPAIASTHT